jgi:hypothetical protein
MRDIIYQWEQKQDEVNHEEKAVLLLLFEAFREAVVDARRWFLAFFVEHGVKVIEAELVALRAQIEGPVGQSNGSFR